MSTPDFVLDKRVVDRNIKKGLLTKEDLEKRLAKLPDVEDNAEVCAPGGGSDEAADEAE